MTNHAFKMVNMLLGNIDAPGGHVGVTLDDKMQDRGHIKPGENGMIDVVTHPFGPPPPFSYPPNETNIYGYFPFGWIPGHLNHEVLKQPEKFDLPYRPDTILLCHANPLWNVPGDRKVWHAILRSMRFIVAIDIIPNETNEFADIILPAHDFFEGWNLLMNDAAHTEGMSLRQPVSQPLYDTKSEEDIFNELADRLGFLKEWNEMLNIATGLESQAGADARARQAALRQGHCRPQGEAMEWQGSRLVHRARSLGDAAATKEDLSAVGGVAPALLHRGPRAHAR